jgi:hypothetical protein
MQILLTDIQILNVKAPFELVIQFVCNTNPAWVAQVRQPRHYLDRIAVNTSLTRQQLAMGDAYSEFDAPAATLAHELLDRDRTFQSVEHAYEFGQNSTVAGLHDTSKRGGEDQLPGSAF